jgi:lysophospholipase L1-like esterase
MLRFPQKRSARLWKLVLPLSSVVLCFYILELVFRVFVYLNLVDYPKADYAKIIHRYSYNPELVYEMKPSFSTYDKGVLVMTNGWGIRDREYSLLKPPGVVRIAVIGDSVAFGPRLKSEDTFSKLLEVRLNSLQPGRYEVINFSVIGYNSAQEEIVLKEKVISTKPDVVILAFCMNDDTYTDGLGDLARQMHPSSIGPRLHSKLLSYLLHRWERRHFVSRSSFTQIEHLFEQLSILGRRERFQSVILIFPFYFDDIHTYPLKEKHRTVGNLANKYSFPVVDLMERWGALSPSERRRLYPPEDNIHMTTLGMQETTKELMKRLTTLSSERN